MENNLQSKDFYCVYNDYDIEKYFKELNLLYLPLIGSDSIKLYSFLASKMLGDKNLSKNYLHYDIFDNLALEDSRFVISRKKLEALGLLRSYYFDNNGTGQYVYKIQEPLSFSEFFNTPILAQLLENTIGSNEYNELRSFYMEDRVSFSSFTEISAKFSDIYRLENADSYAIDFSTSKEKAGLNFDDYNFDFSKLNYYLASNYLGDVIDDEKVKNDILGLAHLYKADVKDVAKGIEKSVDLVSGNSVLNIEKLKDYLRQLYVNIRKQEVPTLDKMISKKILEDNKEELSEEEMFIREVDNTSYIDYLNKQKGLILSSVDAKSIESLQSKYNFPTGVLNILLDYSISISGGAGVPHINYIDKIASQWKSQNLLGAQDAIDYARKLKLAHSKRQTTNTTKRTTKKATSGSFQNKKVYTAPFPEYLQNRMESLSGNKTNKKRVATDEEKDAYNKMMEELNKGR